MDNGEVLYRVELLDISASNRSKFRGLDAEKHAVLEQWWSHFRDNFLENCFRQVGQNTSHIEMEESKMMFQATLKGETCGNRLTSGWQRSKAAAKKSVLRRWFEQLRSRVLHRCYHEIYNATPTFTMDVEGCVSLEAPTVTTMSTQDDEESALLGENLVFQFALRGRRYACVLA